MAIRRQNRTPRPAELACRSPNRMEKGCVIVSGSILLPRNPVFYYIKVMCFRTRNHNGTRVMRYPTNSHRLGRLLHARMGAQLLLTECTAFCVCHNAIKHSLLWVPHASYTWRMGGMGGCAPVCVNLMTPIGTERDDFNFGDTPHPYLNGSWIQ